MAYNQARFSKKLIKCKILNTVVQIASSEYRERSILHDGEVPHVGDFSLVAILTGRRNFSIHRSGKAIELESKARFR